VKFGITILGERVSPRCSFADELLVVTKRSKGQIRVERLSTVIDASVDLVEILESHDVDTLICGGVSQSIREALFSREINIVDNVACSIEEVLDAIRTGRLRSGYGMTEVPVKTDEEKGDDDTGAEEMPPRLDCLTCLDRKCQRGESCLDLGDVIREIPKASRRMIEATLDVSQEKDRVLCRVSELVYFCLEMGYKHLGIAYCTDLFEPAEILTGVLRRFFDITPVCCKVGGIRESVMLGMSGEHESAVTEHESAVTCNPLGQARVLNHAETQLNILVGLCLGADCLFTSASEAPVTTFLVKDKSLAHNPIGALYSEYYLKESLQAAKRIGRVTKRHVDKRVASDISIESMGKKKQEENP
jgi:uncharacterized metal-binding protein/predicted Fe-Mo cluster-binding NifX family protein